MSLRDTIPRAWPFESGWSLENARLLAQARRELAEARERGAGMYRKVAESFPIMESFQRCAEGAVEDWHMWRERAEKAEALLCGLREGVERIMAKDSLGVGALLTKERRFMDAGCFAHRELADAKPCGHGEKLAAVREWLQNLEAYQQEFGDLKALRRLLGEGED